MRSRPGALLLLTAVLLCAGPSPGQRIETLPGTGPLAWTDELDVRLMDGAHRFVERKIAESPAGRARFWKRDFGSPAAYEASVAPQRRRLLEIIGGAGPRAAARLERFGDDDNPAQIAETPSLRIYQVRWPVAGEITGEGLLLEPKAPPRAVVIAIPDAAQTPEEVAGLTGSLPAPRQFARRLAEAGSLVLAPAVVDRSPQFSGRPHVKTGVLPHREWVYRQAFHMGRHIIGMEVSKIQAALDWARARYPRLKTGVAGYAEGGLLAFYAAAADTRVDAALVSGYFGPRERVWSETIDRNLWGLLREFGDAEIATLAAPRPLVIEYCPAPEVHTDKGDLTTPPYEEVRREFDRIAALLPAGFQQRRLFRAEAFASEPALGAFLESLSAGPPAPPGPEPEDRRRAFSPAERMRRQVAELDRYVQSIVDASERTREAFFLHSVMPEFARRAWSVRLRHDTVSPDRFIEAQPRYRRHLEEEVLGRFDDALLAPHPRTRKIYDNPKWTGYDVVLDVWPDVIAWGILLVPKDVQSGERRPAVVCQHGRNGLPKTVIEEGNTAYNGLGARLADRGFVVFAPHNLYRGEDRYRWLDRKANSVQASMFTFIIAQHRQITGWLASLPFVDPARIAFYGLSYGGETAVRVPPLVERYCLSICSGDFNNWTRKVAGIEHPFSFPYTIEWEMPYFNMGNTFDYAELAYLIFPRPFMVERGHHDMVSFDQLVAGEYAKVRRLYAEFGMPDRTGIEFFLGGHAINGEGTFRFLEKRLGWPAR